MSDQESTPRVTQRWLSNSRMRDALLVVDELLGRNGQTAVLRLSGLERYIGQLPPNNDEKEVPRGDLVALFAGIVSMFGDQGARGVLRRWGRAFAVRSLEARFALRVMRLVLRLLPAERSTPYVLARLLHHLDLASEEQPPTIDDQGEYYILQITDCLYCFGQSQSQSHCIAMVGLLEGMLRWTTGNDHDVTEEPPTASGPPTFRIRKQPIGRH